MKKMLLMLLAAFLVLMTAISCKPAEEIPDKSSGTSSHEDYPFTGVVQPGIGDASKSIYGTF